MTTDNRTNEVTDEQVEEAAKAMWERTPRKYDPTWADLDYGIKEIWRKDARAALVAAQGAAPRAEGEYGDRYTCADLGHEDCGLDNHISLPVPPSSTTPQAEAYDHCCQHPKCPGGSLCCCASEQRLRDCWNQWREEIAGDSKQAFRDGYQAGQNDPAPWLTAPVLPSSGVDEEALAEVIRKLRFNDAGCWAAGIDCTESVSDHADVIARAVVAYLRGES